jgi:formylglycine-generating enzyme required for sulfatase activity
MRSPLALLHVFAKAASNAIGGEVAGDVVVEVLPDVARDVWDRWGKGRPEAELRDEIQEVARLSPEQAREQASLVLTEEASGVGEPVLKLVRALVARVPATMQASQRSITDPTGRTVRPSFRLREPRDLLALLPERLPRFTEGQELPGYDRRLVELLGVGGFGEVWRAVNPRTGKESALKFCLDAGAGRNLEKEVELLVRVQNQGRHDGIVQLLDTRLSADPPFVEYEYIRGGNLASVIESWAPLAPERRVASALKVMYKLAGIVGFAHRVQPKAIIHRDLKPANVLVEAASAGTFRLKVADYGIGGVAVRHAVANLPRYSSPGAFLTTALRGSYTPIYASPEQRLRQDPNPRDDVYSLGVIWLHLLTGDLTREPGSDFREELARLNPSEPMMALLERCLAQKAERRPEDAAVLEKELGALLGVNQLAVGRQPREAPHSPPPPRPDSEDNDAAERPIASLHRFDAAHERARAAMKRCEFKEAARILEGIPQDHRNHAEHARACKARDRRDFLDPAIKAAADQQNLLELRLLLSEALYWMPERADLAKLRDVVYPRTNQVTNSLPGMRFAFIPPGAFEMGSPDNEPGRQPNEGPLHKVKITRGFWLGIHEVTQKQFKEVMGYNPSCFSRDGGGKKGLEYADWSKPARGKSKVPGDTSAYPVENVSWEETKEFCAKLSQRAEEKRRGWTYRLPTEAEWEYACRGGAPSYQVFHFGDSLSSKQANFDGNYPYGGAGKGGDLNRPCKVGSYAKNRFGLYDMHGNVWEWCSDCYADNYYQKSPKINPPGPGSGTRRVLRGGCWSNDASLCRSAFRDDNEPGYRVNFVGFRVVLLPE